MPRYFCSIIATMSVPPDVAFVRMMIPHPTPISHEQMVAEIENAAKKHGRIQALHGFRRIAPFRHDVHQGRGEECGKDGAASQRVAEDDEREAEQRNIEHIAEGSHLDAGNDAMEHDAGTIHSARDNVVRVDEEHVGQGQYQAPHENLGHIKPPSSR